MNTFERTYQIDNSIEKDGPREKHTSIELSDTEYAEKFYVKFSNKIALFNNGEVGVIVSDPPPIPMKLEMPELEKAIKEGKKNAKSKSKSTKKKSVKNDSKANRSSVESVQEKV